MSKKGIRKKHFSIVFRCKLVGSISKESGDLMGDASVPAFVFLLGECNVAAIGAGFEVGFVAVIPFAFARAISVEAKRNCGSPYTKREEEMHKQRGADMRNFSFFAGSGFLDLGFEQAGFEMKSPRPCGA